jgi:NitT/TauT family transport system permease protein
MSEMSVKRANRAESVLLPLALGAVLVALWQAGVVWSGTRIFPSPLRVVRGAYLLAANGLLLRYTAASLFRLGTGFALGTTLGVPLGLAMGWYKGLSIAVDPIIQILRPISPIAWIPVTIVAFGVANSAPIFIVFLGCFLPIVTVTSSAVRNIPPSFVKVGRNFGLSPVALFARVILPAALPEVLGGLRLALGIGWIVLVAGEMIAVNSGLGYLVLDSRNAGQRYDLVVAGMGAIGVVGLLLDAALRQAEKIRSLHWGFSSR